MKKLLKNIIYLTIALSFLSACQSLKDGLTGQQKNNSDEFLVEKKNPLVLPPEFDKLPTPEKLSSKKSVVREIDLKAIIAKETSSKNTSSIEEPSTKNTSSIEEPSTSSLEKTILEKIKSN